MRSEPGPGGTLLPERYVATALVDDGRAFLGRCPGDAQAPALRAARLGRWWNAVEQTCGPATPIRAIFDLFAMPWLAMLGFRCHDAVFDRDVCRARLSAGTTAPVALLVTCWAARPPTRWVDLARHAETLGARWGIVLAPPFVSIVAVRGFATRRSLDLRLPDAIDPSWVDVTSMVAGARAFARTISADPAPSRALGRRTCLLEHLIERAGVFQDAVRNDLQRGVETSLSILRPAVRSVAHPRRGVLRDDRDPDHEGDSVQDEALTLVYRVLFLLFAESRQLVPIDQPIYEAAYAVSRFCREATTGRGVGLWTSVAAASRLSRLGCRSVDLRVSPFNGALFSRSAAPRLEAAAPRSSRDIAERCDEAMRDALVALGSRATRAGVESIAYRDLGVEQLGAVYERLLDLPRHDAQSEPEPGQARWRHPRHSTRRRRTGTFYTPQSLADLVVRQTLAPLVAQRSADRILDLRVVDPAMGSGAFLVAACRFLAAAYEEALLVEGRLSAEDIDEHERACMRRLVAERCLAGVDRNPMAVELARLSLWLTTLARGRPLSFLDHRLRVGDSLLGARPGDIWRLSRRRRERCALPLFGAEALDEAMRAGIAPLRAIVEGPSETVANVRAKEMSWRRFESAASPLHRWRLALHVWCARWFSDNPPGPQEARAVVDALVHGDETLARARVESRTAGAVATAVTRGFFHWPLEFPDIFADPDGRGEDPGFDAVIGNPPWEMVRKDDGEIGPVRPLVDFIRESGLYPSCTGGHLNLYQAFVDRSLSLVRKGGRIGLVLPWGIAVDDGAEPLRDRLWRETRVDTIVGIDNAHGLFPIHRGLRIACLAASADGPTRSTRAVFGLSDAAQLDALPAIADSARYPVSFTPAELEGMSGRPRRIPDLRRNGDRAFLADLNGRLPRLHDPRGWAVSFSRELNATDVRPHLGTRGIRVIEGKHLAPFVVDDATASRLPPAVAASRLERARWTRPRLGYRDVSGVGNRLTLIAAVIPAGAVTTHTVFCVRRVLSSEQQHFLCALLNSVVLNAVVRLLMGGHVTTTLAESLPAPVWTGDPVDRQIARIARHLATHLHRSGSSSRRPGNKGTETSGAAQLQALVARRFGIDRATLEHVLDGVPRMTADERASVLDAFRALEDRTRR